MKLRMLLCVTLLHLSALDAVAAVYEGNPPGARPCALRAHGAGPCPQAVRGEDPPHPWPARRRALTGARVGRPTPQSGASTQSESGKN